jgi:hypothetical protein
MNWIIPDIRRHDSLSHARVSVPDPLTFPSPDLWCASSQFDRFGSYWQFDAPLSSVNNMRPSRSAAATTWFLIRTPRIGRSRQVLVQDCVGVVPGQMQIRNEIDRQVFINLEFHLTCKGISRSSCANSAA